MEESVGENLTCVIIKSNIQIMQWNIYISLTSVGNKCCYILIHISDRHYYKISISLPLPNRGCFYRHLSCQQDCTDMTITCFQCKKFINNYLQQGSYTFQYCSRAFILCCTCKSIERKTFKELYV